MAADLRIRMLGGFAVWVGQRAVAPTAWRVRKASSLIKLLALAPEHRLHREPLCELLWPEATAEAAGSNLRYALHAARHALSTAGEADRLGRDGPWLLLGPAGALETDVARYEAAAADARRSALFSSRGDPIANAAAMPTPRHVVARPTTGSQCRNGGWASYGDFKNQRDCVSFVATRGKSSPAGR